MDYTLILEKIIILSFILNILLRVAAHIGSKSDELNQADNTKIPSWNFGQRTMNDDTNVDIKTLSCIYQTKILVNASLVFNEEQKKLILTNSFCYKNIPSEHSYKEANREINAEHKKSISLEKMQRHVRINRIRALYKYI